MNTGLISSETAPFDDVKQDGLGHEGWRRSLKDNRVGKDVSIAIEPVAYIRA